MSRAIALLFILYAFRLASQTVASFEQLSSHEGLSQGMVFDILQSRDGFLWVATKDGLNRYDGYRFEVFSHDAFDPNSLSQNECRQLYEDSRGWLWISHPTGMDVYQPQTGKFLPTDSLGLHLPKLIFRRYFFADLPDGHIWICVPGEPNVYIFKPAENGQQAKLDSFLISAVPAQEDGRKPSVFIGIFLTKNDGLYVGTNAGLYHAEQVTPPYRLSFVNGTASISSNSLLSMGEVESGGFGLMDGASIWSIREGKVISQKNLPEPGNWYLAWEGKTWNGQPQNLKCWQYESLVKGADPLFEIPVPTPLQKVSPALGINKIVMDRAGVYWFATNGYGLLKWTPNKRKFQHFFPGKSFRQIKVTPNAGIFFTIDNLTIWEDGDFTKSRPNDWLAGLSDLLRWEFSAFDKDGNFWVLGSSADQQCLLCRVDSQTKKVVKYPKPCHQMGLLLSNNGNLLSISDDCALVSFNPQTGESTSTPFKKIEQRNIGSAFLMGTLYEDAQGVVWIYHFPGLIKAVPDGKGWKFSYFQNNPNDRSSLSDNFILSLQDDPIRPEQYLWVGTKGGGLNRLDKKTGKFRHFKTQDGLPDNVVYAVLADGSGHLWLSTNRGLSRFDVVKEEFKNFTAADGLQSDEFNQSSFLKTPDGRLIFGGINGINAFHPDSLRFNLKAPQVAITRLSVNNHWEDFRLLENGILKRPLNVTDRIDLDYSQNLLSIEFSALDFTSPTQNHYRYRLTGVDKDWVEAGQRNSVQYANLQPGQYIFEVNGSNNDGIWSETPAKLEIVILPPWWRTKLASFLYLLAFLAGAFALYRFQINRAKLKNQLDFEHREAARLAELDRIKTDFFSNITHEFRTPLTLILEPVRQMLNEDTNGHFAQRLSLVKNNGEKMLALVNQLLDMAKLEGGKMELDLRLGDIMETIRPIFQSFAVIAKKKGIQLKMSGLLEVEAFYFDVGKVEKVLTNLLSNAVKFTSQGAVNVEIKQLEIRNSIDDQFPISYFQFLISDTGPGIPPDAQHHIFERFYQVDTSSTRTNEGTGIGLALTKELVELMGGTIDVESEVGKGATFTVTLPMANRSEMREVRGEERHSGNLKIESAHSSTLAPQPSLFTPHLSLLIIEDNPELRQFIQSILSSQYQVVEASNGAEGIRKAKELIPDLVISDVMMPEKDGFQVCDELKNDYLTSHIPIILLTAKTAIDSKIQGLRTGADAYLSKPFHTEELLVRIEKLIEGRRHLLEKFSHSANGHSIKKLVEELPIIENEFLRKFTLILEEQLDDETLSVESLASKMFVSRVQLHRKLKALTDQSANEFVRNYRLDRALELLKNKEGNVMQVSIMVGFGNEKYFSTRFKERFGYSPSEV